MSGSRSYLTDEIVEAFALEGVPWQMITPRLAELKRRQIDLEKRFRVQWAEAARALVPPGISYFKFPERKPR